MNGKGAAFLGMTLVVLAVSPAAAEGRRWFTPPWRKSQEPPAQVPSQNPWQLPTQTPQGDPLPPPMTPGLQQGLISNPPRIHNFDAVASPILGTTPTTPGSPTPPPQEQLTTFDPLAVELKYNVGHWLLTAGGKPLKDFGSRSEDARQAWHLIRELRLNQHATIGSPRPVVEYWLHDGQPPRNIPRGYRVIPLDVASLKVEQAQGFWVMRESSRVLFNFGPNEADARQALGMIQRYGFNRVGMVGRAGPSMLVFVSHPDLDRRSQSRLEPAELPGLKPVKGFSAAPKLTPLGMGKMPGLNGQQGPTVPATFYPTPMVPSLQSGTGTTQAPWTSAGASPSIAVHHSPFNHSDQTPWKSAGVAERIPFDWRQVQVQPEGGVWKVAVGSFVLGHFNNEREARLAQAALSYYRLTEYHRVGGTQPPVGYFLANGQAPRGHMPGLMGQHFQSGQLSVAQIGQHYCVTQGGGVLMDCGPREEDARQILGAIQRHGFDQLYRIGQDERTGLTFFARSY
jgi:hypothetical protein